jgi:hypothetical protein
MKDVEYLALLGPVGVPSPRCSITGAHIARLDNVRPARRCHWRRIDAPKRERSPQYPCSEASITSISTPHDVPDRFFAPFSCTCSSNPSRQPASSPRARDVASVRRVDGTADCRMLRLGLRTATFLVHDRDSCYGTGFDRRVRNLGIAQVRTPFRGLRAAARGAHVCGSGDGSVRGKRRSRGPAAPAVRPQPGHSTSRWTPPKCCGTSRRVSCSSATAD